MTNTLKKDLYNPDADPESLYANRRCMVSSTFSPETLRDFGVGHLIGHDISDSTVFELSGLRKRHSLPNLC